MSENPANENQDNENKDKGYGRGIIDIGQKESTSRSAKARGELSMGKEAFELLENGELPKGDVLTMARVAGVMAAKKCADTVPLCHPIGLDKVSVDYELDRTNQSVAVFCTASTSAKTGVEMEALCGLNGALLCLYDVIKNVDPALTMSEMRLVEKVGGKKGHWIHPAEK